MNHEVVFRDDREIFVTIIEGSSEFKVSSNQFDLHLTLSEMP